MLTQSVCEGEETYKLPVATSQCNKPMQTADATGQCNPGSCKRHSRKLMHWHQIAVCHFLGGWRLDVAASLRLPAPSLNNTYMC